ncbi:spike base protein, RCAP_Rcc01079 family [Pseudotabrizicola formosa]|uniref:spike base protein, RCAP_Rcc01079 family n=1 Tax=Pseudotabrizicola formosa TaxID=2030009 RepID=UPI000CD1A76D|nr:hypothetical protein [Pseudotabrizicola formosa]
MSDVFKSHQAGLDSPAEAASPITASDTQPLPLATRAIYVGGPGTLRVTMVSGDTVTLTGVLGGMIYPLRVSHVLATGTTASGLVGLR